MVRGEESDHGFTLIELMLVSAIVGLLASIAIPKFASLIDKAREATLKGQLGAIRSALGVYYADNEGGYPRFNALPPSTYGLWHLNGKYIDFDEITFSLPRYAQKATGWKSSTSATEMYKPSGMGGWWSVCNYSDLTAVAHAGIPIPTYSVNNSAFGGDLGTRAELIIGAVDSSHVPLKDLSGRDWSSW